MKKLLLIILIITGLAACKSNADKSQQRDIQLLPDPGSYTSNILSDTNSVVKAEAVPEKISEKPNTKTIIRTIVIERPAPQNSPVREATKHESNTAPVVNADPVSAPPVKNDSASQNTSVDNSSTAGTSGTATSSDGEKVQKKAGMTKATQGAIIGGVAGAVGGAVISKKKGLGAVVGGIAGAAGGYIIGKNMDKKDNKFMID